MAYVLTDAERVRKIALFNARTELQHFQLRGDILAGGPVTLRFDEIQPGFLGGGGSDALNGGVIAAGFDALAVLAGIASYPTDLIVTAALNVQYFKLARLDDRLRFEGASNRAGRTRAGRTIVHATGALRTDEHVYATMTAILVPIMP